MSPAKATKKTVEQTIRSSHDLDPQEPQEAPTARHPDPHRGARATPHQPRAPSGHAEGARPEEEESTERIEPMTDDEWTAMLREARCTGRPLGGDGWHTYGWRCARCLRLIDPANDFPPNPPDAAALALVLGDYEELICDNCVTPDERREMDEAWKQQEDRRWLREFGSDTEP
jgi:hypothetical protein